jgi:uncharacterized protein (UPF0371 family)
LFIFFLKRFPPSVYVEPSHALYEATGINPPDRHVAAEARRKKRLAAQEVLSLSLFDLEIYLLTLSFFFLHVEFMNIIYQ